MAEIISIINQKGGVGKTTTAINFASILGASDYRVLVVDIDPQWNCTTGLGAEKKIKGTLYDYLEGDKNGEDIILKNVFPGLDLIPASRDIAGIEKTLLARDNFFALKELFDSIGNDYDFIIIDCPPSAGILTINALCASTRVIIPSHCEYFSYQGLVELFPLIEEIKTRFNQRLRIGGILLTMVDKNIKLSADMEKELRHTYPDKVYETVIYKSARIPYAINEGKPIIFSDYRSPVANNYIAFTKEFLTKEGYLG